MRIALGVEYDGADFSGWQSQKGVRTVQDVLQAAVSSVADGPIVLHCAGRTDAGVHAMWQVVHFDTDAERSDRSWILGCNVNLPKDVNVLWARKVSDDFHARFSATRRYYRYEILNRPTRSGLLRGHAVWIHQSLDEFLMREAGSDLIGTHDFSSYRALGCQAKNPVRTVYSLAVSRYGERISIDISANAFLHHMVRNIAGVLISIGKGDRPVSWARDVLERLDRTRGGVTAPPQGLYLVGIDYPDHFALPRSRHSLF